MRCGHVYGQRTFTDRRAAIRECDPCQERYRVIPSLLMGYPTARKNADGLRSAPRLKRANAVIVGSLLGVLSPEAGMFFNY